MKITLLEVPLKLFLKCLKLVTWMITLSNLVLRLMSRFWLLPSSRQKSCVTRTITHSNVFFFFVLASWTQSEKEIQVLREQKSQRNKHLKLRQNSEIRRFFREFFLENKNHNKMKHLKLRQNSEFRRFFRDFFRENKEHNEIKYLKLRQNSEIRRFFREF